MSTPANALDISTIGIVKFDGVNAFTTTTITQFDTLVGGASNAITSITTGIAGQVLTSNGAGADPSYQNSASSGITQIDGDSGSATGATITFNATPTSGSTVLFAASGSSVAFDVTDLINHNTIIGNNAGNGTISGNANTGFGELSLQSLTSGGGNTAVGVNALNKVTTGSNTAIGNGTLRAVTTGSHNTGMGSGVLQSLITGVSNTAIGLVDTSASGQNYSGAESSNIVIANVGTLGESNVIRIGTQGAGTGQQNTCFIAGITGVTTTNSNFVTIDTTTGQLGAVATAGGVTWSVIGASQTLVVANGYFCTTGAALSLALPATSAVGDTIDVVLDGSTSWTITQPNAATRIRIGTSQTTLGVGGSLASTATGDSISLVCETANARWVVISSMGNITVV